MRVRWLNPLVLMSVAAGVVLAQEGENKAKPDPSGTWKWERDFNGNKIDYTLRLKRQDAKLTGTYRAIFENRGPGRNDPVKIQEGKIEADTISFTVTRRFNQNEFTIAYAGKIAGDTITGQAEVRFRNGAREFPWNAKRVVTREDLVGTWKLKFETPNGVIEPSLTLTQDGEKLVGTYHSTFFGDNPIKDIEVRDNKLSFVVAFQTQNGEFSITYKAEPRGDKIAGVILSNFGGRENETPFEGTRDVTAKEEEDKDEDA